GTGALPWRDSLLSWWMRSGPPHPNPTTLVVSRLAPPILGGEGITRRLVDDAGLLPGGELLGRVAENLAVDVRVVLAEARGAARQGEAAVAEADRHVCHREAAQLRVVDADNGAARAELRVVEEILAVLHGAGRDARDLQLAHDGVGVALARPLGDEG